MSRLKCSPPRGASRLRIPLGLVAIWLLTANAAFAASSHYQSVEKTFQRYMWLAGIFAIVIFFIVLWGFGRKSLEKSDKLNVDWEKEEARMRQIAEMRKIGRTPEEKRALVQPSDRANAGVAGATRRPLEPGAPAAPTASMPPADDLSSLIGGLND
ncbi:MAG: hypothetical protein ABI743_04905 [bacterium]